jgi:signal transduction histidine kinase/CheY-like chemotaxis protein
MTTDSHTHSTPLAGPADRLTPSQQAVVTDTMFRRKFLDHPWQQDAGILFIEAAVPVVIFVKIVQWQWLLAWEGLWVISTVWRMLMRYRYARRYPLPRMPRTTRHWRVVRHAYHAFTWLVTGLVGLFCFVPNAIEWEIAAVACLGMVYTLAPSDAVESTEIFAGAITLPIPVVAMLIARGTTLHYGLAALVLGFVAIVATWGMQQVGTHRQEIILRLALQREKQRAEEANIAKSKFLAAASHDLRQPLHALSLFVGALKTQIHYPAVRAVVSNIENSVQALDGLFHALLDVSKLDAGTVVPKPSNFWLDTLLLHLSSEYRDQAQAKGIDWDCDCVDTLVHTDPALLETVIRNLVSNAIRYTDHGGVRVRCDRRDGGIHLTIADSGVGIPLDKQQEVFGEFVQLHNPERDRNKGLGLGLSIVNRLTRLLRISYTFESTPGVGTRFTLVVPPGDSSATILSMNDKEDIGLANALAGKTVLVVDDERDILEGTRVLLESWGALPILAESEADAAALLRGGGAAPDLVIVDFRLRDGVTGDQALHQLRACLGRPVPAIIVTGDTAPARLKEAAAAGFLLLHKPVKPAKLRLAMLHALIS